MGCFKRTALKHVYYLGWNRSPAQVGCMRQALGPGALGRPRRIRWRGRWEGGSGWGIHVNPWQIHFNVWQNPLQYKKKYVKVCFMAQNEVLFVVQSLCHNQLFETPWTAAYQASLSFSISRSLLKLMSIESMILSNHLLLFCPLLLPLVFPSIRVFTKWVSSSHQVAKVLELQLQHQSFQWIFRVDFLQDGLAWSCSPRDSQESSPTPQFKSINSSELSFLYSPNFTSIHDYWKSHSFDYKDLYWQSDISAF